MSSPHPKRHLATFEDLLRLPEDVRAEIVGGEIVEKAAPSLEHSRAQRRLGAQVEPFERRRGAGGPGGWWIGSEVDVEYDAHELYRHDLSGWRRDRVPELPRTRPVRVRPDWVCEILSPSNWANDTVAKFRTLQRHGVPHYWIVDLERAVLTVYRFSDGLYTVAAVAQPGERARLEPFAEIEMEVGVLFGQDPDDQAS
jgi:Uma2 family endonuclease